MFDMSNSIIKLSVVEGRKTLLKVHRCAPHSWQYGESDDHDHQEYEGNDDDLGGKS
jgi:hypothetical protein